MIKITKHVKLISNKTNGVKIHYVEIIIKKIIQDCDPKSVGEIHCTSIPP